MYVFAYKFTYVHCTCSLLLLIVVVATSIAPQATPSPSVRSASRHHFSGELGETAGMMVYTSVLRCVPNEKQLPPPPTTTTRSCSPTAAAAAAAAAAAVMERSSWNTPRQVSAAGAAYSGSADSFPAVLSSLLSDLRQWPSLARLGVQMTSRASERLRNASARFVKNNNSNLK